MNLTPEQFLEYTPQELTGVLHLMQLQKDAKFKSDWERTRIQTFYLINIQLDKKNKLSYEKFRRDVWPFFWEKKKVISTEGVMTPEQWNAILNKQVTTVEVSENEAVSL